MTGVKVKTLGELKEALGVVKTLMTREMRLNDVFMSGVATALCAEFIEVLKYIDGAEPYTAVSYTHLDVYKRQELQRTLTALAENEKEWQTRMEHLRREEVLAGKKSGAAMQKKASSLIKETNARLERKKAKSRPGLPSQEAVRKRLEENAQRRAAAERETQICEKRGARLAKERKEAEGKLLLAVSYTHLDVYKRQGSDPGTGRSDQAAAGP